MQDEERFPEARRLARHGCGTSAGDSDLGWDTDDMDAGLTGQTALNGNCPQSHCVQPGGQNRNRLMR